MTKTKRCFFLETLRTGQIRKGVFWLSEKSKPNGGWIAVDALGVLENVSMHKGLSLLELRTAKISGAVIKLVTSETIPADGADKPLLAISPSKKFLDRLDNIPNISEMMVSPHGADEVDEWAKRNNARYYYDVGGTSDKRVAELVSVIKAALEDMTNTINSIRKRSPGAYCFDIMTSTLYVLNQYGYDLDPVSIGDCLIKDYNWGPVSAKLVDELAEDLKSDNRQFFGPDLVGYWKDNEDVMEKWKAKARSGPSKIS